MITEDKQGLTEIVVEALVPGFLVLSDTFYPGWKAEVDGNPTEIYRANYAFRAVPVDAGNHTVKFFYTPTHWKVGILISSASLLIAIAGLGYTLVKKK